MDPCLHDQFAEIEQRHWWFQGRRAVLTCVLREQLGHDTGPTSERRIFDAGCGTGEMIDMLRAFGSVSAIDPSEDAVRRCVDRFDGTVDVRCGELPRDLPPSGCEMVTAFDVLEHLDDDLGALEAIHAVLPDGGVVVITVPAYAFLWGQHDVINGHRRRYRARQIRALLEASGFQVDRLTYFNTLLFPIVVLVRASRRLRSRGAIDPASDFTMPRPAVNRLLLAVFSFEARLLRRASLPFGVSILAVGRKPPRAR